MQNETNFHMSMDDFRRNGYALIDWIANYYEKLEEYPVLSRVQPGQVRNLLPDSAPQDGESFERIMQDIDRIIVPGITHWQSPNFFAFFPSNSSGPAILGDLLSSGLGVQGMLWITSPACTELETHMLDWLVDALDLPGKFKSNSKGGGVIQDSASSAALCAVLAAREQASNFSTNEIGYNERLTAYTTSQAHSSIEKAIKIAGAGRQNLRMIEVDADFAMRPVDLANQIKQDRQNGWKPFFVSATVGTTSSNALDPLAEIGRICQDENLWLHVDAAMSGTAALCPEFRYIHQGLDLADSYCFNPHKWMFTNFDCDCFYVANREMLIRTLSVLPEYLRNQASESGAVIDYRDWQVPLGRRFRSLKLWFVIRHYGIKGLQFHIRKHVEMAQSFASWVRESNDFELVAPVPLNLVCFSHKLGDQFNLDLMNRLNQSGKIYLNQTKLADRLVLRFSIGQTFTESHHVRAAWELINRISQELMSERRS